MNKCEILDLTAMSIEDTKLLNEIYMRNRKKYTQMIDALSKKWRGNIYWWSTHLASRNTLLSNAYKDICIVLLAVQRIETEKKIKKVILPNKEISDTLDGYYKQKKRTVEFVFQQEEEKNYYRDFFFLVMRKLSQKRIVDKVMPVPEAIIGDEKIVLIDTEILASHVKRNNYQDRLFGNIENYTDKKIVFLPVLVEDIRINFEAFVNKIAKTRKGNTVLKEQYLKESDYWKMFLFPVWSIIFSGGRKFFRGIDVTEIINRDIKQAISSDQSQEGMLKYFLIKRMRKNKVNIQTLVGWYEGQPSSLGMYMAYHRVYKNRESIGNIGFAPDWCWLSLAPSKEQVRQKVVPQMIGIAGNVFVEIPKQFFQNIKTIPFPAFRLQYLYEHPMVKGKKNRKNILLALSYDIDASKNILEIIKSIDKWFIKQNIKLYIKNHPLFSTMSLKSYGVSELNSDYEFLCGSFQDALKCADIVITAKSTSSYETVLSGRRVIIVPAKNEIVYTFMLPQWKGLLYDVAYSAEELKDIINSFMQMEPAGVELDDAYLVKASSEVYYNIL